MGNSESKAKININSGLKYLTLNSILFSSTVISLRTAGFISQILIMKFSNVTNYNLVVQAIVIQALSTVIFSWGFEAEVTNQLVKSSKTAITSLRVYLVTFIACAVSCIFLFVMKLAPAWILLSILSGLILGIISGLILPILRFLRLGKFTFFISTISATLGIISKYVFIQTGLNPIFAWTFSEFLVSFLTLLFVVLKLHNYSIFDPNQKLKFNFATPYLISVGFWFIMQFDRFYATKFLNPVESASYATLMTISSAFLSIIIEFMRNSDLQILNYVNYPKNYQKIFTRNYIYLPIIILISEFLIMNYANWILPNTYTILFDRIPIIFSGFTIWITGMTLGNIRKYYYKNLSKQWFPIFLATAVGIFFILLVTTLEKQSWYVYFFCLICFGYFIGSVLISNSTVLSFFKYISKLELTFSLLLHLILAMVIVAAIWKN